MKQVLIDKFVLPKNAVEEFSERMNYNRNFIKNLPGFIEDAAFERVDDSGNVNIITVAVWKNIEALKKAKEAVQSEYQRIGFNPPELLSRLNVTSERGVYGMMQK